MSMESILQEPTMVIVISSLRELTSTTTKPLVNFSLLTWSK